MAPSNPTILLVDDELKFLDTLSERLKLLGYKTLKAPGGRQALALAENNRIDLAIVDLKMSGMDGLETITKLKKIHPGLNSVLLTGHGSDKVRQATEALESHYFEKDRMEAFWDFIKQSSETGNTIVIRPPGGRSSDQGDSDTDRYNFNPGAVEIIAERPSGRRPAEPVATIEGEHIESAAGRLPRIIGETLAMQELRRNIDRLAALDCTVIIRGETGTGKELTARVIHSLSPRRNKRFMAINCGNFSNDLLIEELFSPGGTNLGDGVRKNRPLGAYESGGTILLDQIEDMSPKMQLSMLKIVDSQRVFASGDGGHSRFDARIIAAGQHNLRQLVEEGKFREELYHRLNIFELYIPPLRERRDDIPPLSNYFLDNFAADFKKPVKRISGGVISLFMAYDFPGNVRELEHIVERAVILADGDIVETKHLPNRFQKEEPPPFEADQRFLTLAELEKRHILEVLEAVGGNRSKAVEVLGISRAALWRKLKQFEADAAQPPPGSRQRHANKS